MTELWCELAWLGGEDVDAGVVIAVADDRIATVTTGVAVPPTGATRVPGVTVPGLANVHSHAFHRALRGRAQPRNAGTAAGDFWGWREQMFALADRLDPDAYLVLARATFAEMALAGITVVGEFHYLHHERGGVRYSDPNRMGDVIVEAARQAGVRLTLLDTCYLQAGPDGAPLGGVQLRFGDGDAHAWSERADALRTRTNATVRTGAAIHSVRALDRSAQAVVATWATGKRVPLHAHVSEQRAENEACLAATARTPTELLEEAGALDAPLFTAVHATHVSASDITRLGRTHSACCLCPTTERDLADGVGPAAALRDAGAPIVLGSDSHAVIDLFEEARAVELDARLVSGVRGTHGAPELLEAATSAGYASLGWPDGGRIAAGAPADLTTVALEGVRLAGTDRGNVLNAIVFAATAADVRQVMVGGRIVVSDGAHASLDVARELHDAIAAVRA